MKNDTKTRVAKMFALGLSIDTIVDRTGLSRGHISNLRWEIKRDQGIKGQQQRAKEQEPEVIRLVKLGYPTIQIARKLGVERSTMSTRICLLRRRGLLPPLVVSTRGGRPKASLMSLAEFEQSMALRKP